MKLIQEKGLLPQITEGDLLQICFTGKVLAKSNMTQKKNRLRNNKEWVMKRERQQLKSHEGEIRRNGNYRYFLDLGISRFTHGERAFAGVRERVTDKGRWRMVNKGGRTGDPAAWVAELSHGSLP